MIAKGSLTNNKIEPLFSPPSSRGRKSFQHRWLPTGAAVMLLWHEGGWSPPSLRIDGFRNNERWQCVDGHLQPHTLDRCANRAATPLPPFGHKRKRVAVIAPNRKYLHQPEWRIAHDYSGIITELANIDPTERRAPCLRAVMFMHLLSRD